ncbi:WD40 repeat-like protein [Ceratobasidium sp. AG-I]|nr:WD40 repeat-like protein [Ceratobasidium sp. AG-I]
MSASTVLHYESQSPIYALDWCHTHGPNSSRARSAFRIALGTFVEDYRNRITIVGLPDESSLLESNPNAGYNNSSSQSGANASANGGSGGSDFVVLAEAMHGYPPTRLQWEPASAVGQSWPIKTSGAELLATTGDALRVWEFVTESDGGVGPGSQAGYVGRQGNAGLGGKLSQKIALSSSKNPNPTTPPLTSFAWNTISPSLIVTSSIDTTCTVWDISSSTAVTQLIAHDREVYDVAWVPHSTDAFVSVGADGSLRAFDLRSLEHSTILYETPTPAPAAVKVEEGTTRAATTSLLRVAFNPLDANYLATFHMDSSNVQVLDMRNPGQPVVELKGHRGAVSAIGWGAAEGSMLASAGDDCQVLVWDLTSTMVAASAGQQQQTRGPGLASPRPPDGATTRTVYDPAMAYTAPAEISNIAWSPPMAGFSLGGGVHSQPGEWVVMSMGKSVRALKI